MTEEDLAKPDTLDDRRNSWRDIAQAIEKVMERMGLDPARPDEPGRGEAKKVLRAFLTLEEERTKRRMGAYNGAD